MSGSENPLDVVYELEHRMSEVAYLLKRAQAILAGVDTDGASALHLQSGNGPASKDDLDERRQLLHQTELLQEACRALRNGPETKDDSDD